MELPKLFIDEDGDACFLPSGADRNLVALPARDEDGNLLNPEIWHGMIDAWNRRADLPSPLGAVAMRDAAEVLIRKEVITAKSYRHYYVANMLDEVGNIVAALPIPTHAAMLATALKLPEIAALVDAANSVNHDNIHGNGLEGFRANRERLYRVLAALEASHE